MKKTLSVVAFILILLGLLSGCQQKNTAGGFSEGRSVTADDLKIYERAMGNQSSNYQPITVETQVVAGTNYRFYAKDSKGEFFNITIFVSLNQDEKPSVVEINKI